MKDKRALQKIRDEFHRFSIPKLQGFSRHWAMIPREKTRRLPRSSEGQRSRMSCWLSLSLVLARM